MNKRLNRWVMTSAAVLALLGSSTLGWSLPAMASGSGVPEGIQVQLDANKGDGAGYRVGEPIAILFRASADAYVTLRLEMPAAGTRWHIHAGPQCDDWYHDRGCLSPDVSCTRIEEGRNSGLCFCIHGSPPLDRVLFARLPARAGVTYRFSGIAGAPAGWRRLCLEADAGDTIALANCSYTANDATAADFDGDGIPDQIVPNRNLPPGQSRGDRERNKIIIGTRGGARVIGAENVDNDPRDSEVIVEDPNLPPNQSCGIDLDGDGDPDVVVVGTKGGAKVTGIGNRDNDPKEDEVIVEDPNLGPGQSYGVDVDGDGDPDIVAVPQSEPA